MAAGTVAVGNDVAGPGGSSDNQSMIMRPAGPVGAGSIDGAPTMGTAGMDFNTGDFMGLIDLEELDFSDFIVMDEIGLPGFSR